MSENEPVAASPAATTESKDTIDRRKPSPVDSDRETEDSFEDAPDAAPDTPVETASVRSLTKRPSNSANKQPPQQAKSQLEEAFKKVRGRASLASNPATGSDKSKDEARADADTEDKDKENIGQNQREHSVSSSTNRISKAASNGDLEQVNLDDDVAPRTKDLPAGKASVDDDLKQSKTLSLSSITSALPSMPWSPTANESPSKAPVSPFAPPPATAPAPPTRKLTSPFSWLSRNSGQKDKDSSASSPPTVSPRRNTASSVATLTSNPEMMLSKLEEEKDDDVSGGANGVGRNSLKDRFKMIRMREEAGIAALPGEDKDGASEKGVGLGVSTTGTMAEDKDGLAVQPPLSPLPTSPNTALTPGTASGVHAGPSAFPTAPVDWDLWQNVINEGPAAVARTSAEDLNRAIATGIPSAIRGVIWQVLAQSKNDELEVVYKELVARGTEKDKDRNSNGSASLSSASNLSIAKEPMSSASSVHSEVGSAMNGSASPTEKDSDALQKAQAVVSAERKRKSKEDAAMLQKLEKAIRRDLGARTSYSKFAAAQGLQEGLFGVCKAYALFDEGVGYAQGMNFLIMPLLFNMPEEEAFCLLVRLMNQYHLRELFVADMPGLHMHLYQFERLLEDLEPALYCHLHRRGISPHLYATQWFLTLFAYRFPLQLVLRIYDLIHSEGLSAILRFGVVLMQKNAAHLLGLSDMSQLTTYLKDRLFDVYIDAAPSAGSILENGFFGSSSSSLDKEVYRADQFVRDACDVKITPELLKAYTAEWEEKTRTEREREAELESLRTGNASLTIKVRRLEDRTEAADREQADIATEMVHTQVRNEELKDENESLKGQVRELRNVIEKQPEELEQAWRLERDDLIKRNEKVHEENMKLEKEMAELEEQLVQTKMRYAEINTEHETLMRKWTDLKRQFA